MPYKICELRSKYKVRLDNPGKSLFLFLLLTQIMANVAGGAKKLFKNEMVIYFIALMSQNNINHMALLPINC